MEFLTEIDMSLHNSSENPQFSTQLPISDDISIFPNTQGSDFLNSIESNSRRSRGGNFTVEEDLLIVSSWLNISLDAVQGNEQKHKAYWTRLWEYFHKHKTFESDRTQISLMNRWSNIQLVTNKFCGCYAQIESRNQSGVNEQDKIANAKVLYKELNKGKPPFQYEHCWNVLRRQPKWLEDCQKKKPMKKKYESSTIYSPSSEIQVNSGDEIIASSNFVDLERPLGRKAEKDKKKRKGKEIDNDSIYVNLLQEMREEKKQFNEKKLELFERAYAQEQERLAYEQQKLQLEQIKEDERVMAIDTTEMPQMLASFYIERQNDILEKRSKHH